MENHLLSTMLSNRDSFVLLKEHLTPKDFSTDGKQLVSLVTAYYAADPIATHVAPELMMEYIRTSVPNPKHQDRLIETAQEAFATDTSHANVTQLVLKSQIDKAAKELALALSNGDPATKLLERYQALTLAGTLDAGQDDEVRILRGDDLDDLIDNHATREGLLKAYPSCLNKAIDGGVEGGDHIILIGRPEIGKSALMLTLACGFATQGSFGIVFNNEERIERLRDRAISCLTGMTWDQIRKDPETAKRRAKDSGFHNMFFIPLEPGTPAQLERIVGRYKPKWFIVDQIRNLAIAKADNRTNQLEAAATAVRNIAKKHDAVGVSVTQAGDSAEGRSVLTMSDIDNSKTGIPGTADVIVGIGATRDQQKEGVRLLSLSKNKLGGTHDHLLVKLDQWTSRISNYA